MADVKAVKSGNWSDPTVWSTGVLPGATDNVYANGFTVTVDQDVTVATLTNAAGGTVAAVIGGQFNAGAGRTINAALNAGQNLGNSAGLVTTTHAAGTLTINGALTGGSVQWAYALYHGTAGAVVVNGTPLGGSGNTANAIVLFSTGSLTVTGNPTGNSAAGGQSANGIQVSGAGTVVVNGDCVAGITAGSSGLSVNAAATVTINGNVRGAAAGTGGGGAGLVTNTGLPGALILVTGSALGSGSVNTFGLAQNGSTITVNGAVTAGSANQAHGVVGSSGGGVLTVAGLVSGSVNTQANGISHQNATMYLNGGVLGVGSAAVVVQNGTTNIVGTVQAGSTGNGLNLSNGAPVANITGDVIGGGGTTVAGLQSFASNALVNITGNVRGATGPGIQPQNAGGTFNITGNAIGGVGSASGAGVFMNVGGSSAILNLYGVAIPSAVAAGVVIPTANVTAFVQVARGNDYPNSGVTAPMSGVTTTTSNAVVVTVDAMECGSGGVVPIAANTGFPVRIFIRSAGTNYLKGYESNLGAASNIGEIAADYPLPANVRKNVTYNFGNSVGSCNVPPAGSVAFGVPVDAATGTASLTPTALLGDPLVARLAQCATVASTGAQIAAANP